LNAKFWSDRFNGTENVWNLGIDGKIILKFIGSAASISGPVTSCREHINVPLVSVGPGNVLSRNILAFQGRTPPRGTPQAWCVKMRTGSG
jgi:hypothetical protein